MNLNKFSLVSTCSDMFEDHMNRNNSDTENLKISKIELYKALGAFYRAILDSILLSLVWKRKAVLCNFKLKTMVFIFLLLFLIVTRLQSAAPGSVERLSRFFASFFGRLWIPFWSSNLSWFVRFVSKISREFEFWFLCFALIWWNRRAFCFYSV